ncbi:hypothetical protein [Nocardia cyriacigeorgica]|uniref:hypothetical protein n=1 Tax=Nocardia cyriacigeorgica TaxID=135487 RepID=UPI002458A803|nr:hypothetical protein [Nocardia cyriacigeorgica]
MARLTEQTRAQKEAAIRAAMDRLLRGQFPPGGKCDVTTLAASGGVTRAALYTTYLHLKEEFERRRDQLRETGVIVDPRDAQIDRLTDQVSALRQRVRDRDAEVASLRGFRVEALSRLAAQHEEILRLRAAVAAAHHVHALPLPGNRNPHGWPRGRNGNGSD